MSIYIRDENNSCFATLNIIVPFSSELAWSYLCLGQIERRIKENLFG